MHTTNFGEHFMLDGYGGTYENLNNRELVFESLTQLPSLLGMKRLSDAYVFKAEDNAIRDPGGWSGIVVIAESHISVHTFPKRGFVSVDVYTCKNGMDCDFISSYFKDKFGLKELELNFVKRGTKYPAENTQKI